MGKYKNYSRQRKTYHNWRNSDNGKALFKQMYDEVNGKCILCQRDMIFPVVQLNHPRKATFDHIVPLAQNGKHNDINNLRVVCHDCNQAYSGGQHSGLAKNK